MKVSDQAGVLGKGVLSARKGLAVLIPAYNENASLPALLAEVRRVLPATDIIVVSDGSVDATARVAREGGAIVLDLPCNLGVGGAVQAGFRFAVEKGYEQVVRIDGDGQHPPSEIPKLLECMRRDPADLVIGVRASTGDGYQAKGVRSIGIKCLACFLSLICRQKITDPTSGFWLMNRPLVFCFAGEYPEEYPEPEALAMLRRQGFAMREVPVQFRARQHGTSSIAGWGTAYYALKVGLALFIDRLRPVNRVLAKSAVLRELEKRDANTCGCTEGGL
jgi:glycosyltransferase involved in cell wall biosynthesis